MSSTIVTITNDCETLEIKVYEQIEFGQVVEEINHQLAGVNTALIDRIIISNITFIDESSDFSRFLYENMLFMAKYVNVTNSTVCVNVINMPIVEVAFDNCVVVNVSVEDTIIESTKLTFTNCTFTDDAFENFSMIDDSILCVQGNLSFGVRNVAASIHKKFNNCNVKLFFAPMIQLMCRLFHFVFR